MKDERNKVEYNITLSAVANIIIAFIIIAPVITIVFTY
tara:strand:+ start:129 stop:242 length:114 start_codon:yes stop_codon:yes gene_type:complete